MLLRGVAVLTVMGRIIAALGRKAHAVRKPLLLAPLRPGVRAPVSRAKASIGMRHTDEILRRRPPVGVDRTVLMSKDGVFFTDPSLNEFGGVFKMDIDGQNLEYIDLVNMASIMPQVKTYRIWGIHTVHDVKHEGTYVCEALAHQVRKATTSDIFAFAGSESEEGDQVDVAALDSRWNGPVDFAFSSKYSAMYVVDRGNKKLKKINLRLEPAFVTKLTKFDSLIVGAACFKKYLFVTSDTAQQVLRVSEVSGIYITFMGAEAKLGLPMALWMDCIDAELYITDQQKNKVVRYKFRKGGASDLDTKTVVLKGPAGVQLADGPKSSKGVVQMVLYIAGSDGQMVILDVGPPETETPLIMKGKECDPNPATKTKSVVPTVEKATKSAQMTDTRARVRSTPYHTMSQTPDRSMTRTDRRDREPTNTKVPSESRTFTPPRTGSKSPSYQFQSPSKSYSPTKDPTVSPSVNSFTESVTATHSLTRTSSGSKEHTPSISLCEDYVVILNTTELKSTELANEESPESVRSIVLTLLCDRWAPTNVLAGKFAENVVNIGPIHTTENGLPYRRGMIMPLFVSANFRLEDDDHRLVVILQADLRFEIIRPETWRITIPPNLVQRGIEPREGGPMIVHVVVPCAMPLYENTQHVSGLLQAAFVISILSAPLNAMDPTSLTLTASIGWMCGKGLVRTAMDDVVSWLSPFKLSWVTNENVNVIASNGMIFFFFWIAVRLMVAVGIQWTEVPDYMRMATMCMYPYIVIWVGWYLHHPTLLHAFRLLFEGSGGDNGRMVGAAVVFAIIVVSLMVVFWHKRFCECEYRPYNITDEFPYLLRFRNPAMPFICKHMFYSGAWGPNEFYGRYSCFILNHENSGYARTWCMLPLVFSTLFALVGSFEPDHQQGIVAQQAVLAFMFLFVGIFYLAVRPLRWIVLNLMTGAIYMLLGSISSANAHSAYGQDCTALVGKGEILKWLGALTFLRSVFWMAATVVEFWTMRPALWPTVMMEDMGQDLETHGLKVDPDDNAESISAIEQEMVDRVGSGSNVHFMRAQKRAKALAAPPPKDDIPRHIANAVYMPSRASTVESSGHAPSVLMVPKKSEDESKGPRRSLYTEEEVRVKALGTSVLPAHLRDVKL